MILDILLLRLLLVCLSLYLILKIALAFDGITLSARLFILIFTISKFDVAENFLNHYLIFYFLFHLKFLIKGVDGFLALFG